MRSSIYNEVETLLRARYPLLYVVTYEERRFEQEVLAEIAKGWNKALFVWSLSRGFVEGDQTESGEDNATKEPLSALKFVREHKQPGIFVLRDFHPFLSDAQVIRSMRDMAALLPSTLSNIVLVSPVMKVPVELEKDITVIDFGPPTLEELDGLLANVTESIKDNPHIKIDLPSEARERILKSALGLTANEAENIFAKAIIKDGKLDESDVPLILEEKRQVIRKSGILEFYDTEESIGQVGGLEVLKEWLTKRSVDFTEDARSFGLPQPRGVLLLGVQGCGKSLVAKAVSSLWGMPLLRFDVGRVFGSLVGQSEEATRRAIRTAEAIAPAVLWIDEIEKGFAGASSGHLDSGVTARVFGTFLTWMQEKKSAVFIVATANNIRAIPPEMLRKGRFDEVFFVDLPSADERKEILGLHLQKRSQDLARFDLETLSEESAGFSGAELEETVVNGLRDALYDGKRQMTTDDVSRNIEQCIPLSVTMKEQIEELRQWAATRARRASATEEVVEVPTYSGRRLEF